MNALAILALMLGLEVAGGSAYSQVLDGDKLRRETYAEAVRRWHTIATAVEKHSADDKYLARVMLTTIRHESNFRRDIHSGDKRGDGGRSWCLHQFKLGKRKPMKTREGYTAAQLIGVDPAATNRCIEVGARVLKRSMKPCSRGNPACIWVNYSGGYYKADHKLIRDRVATLHRTATLSTKLPELAREALGL